jgi:hypothetical protein
MLETRSSSSDLEARYFASASCASGKAMSTEISTGPEDDTNLVLLLPLVALLLDAGDLAFKVLGLDVDLAEPAGRGDEQGAADTMRGACTHFSTVSLTFFSAASSSSSRSWILRFRPSFVTRPASESALCVLSSWTLPSAFSRSPSSTESLCWRDVISWSFSSRSCS